MQLVDLLLNVLGLVALLPYLMPVRSLSLRSSIDDFEHEFSRVLVVFAVSSSVGLEVVEKCSGVLSNFTKVNSLTTLCQEEKAVELLEKDGTRLMDSTEDSLTGVGEFAEEGTDGPGTLGVQTTGRLVEEEDFDEY
jgi:hypothetical protein